MTETTCLPRPGEILTQPAVAFTTDGEPVARIVYVHDGSAGPIVGEVEIMFSTESGWFAPILPPGARMADAT